MTTTQTDPPPPRLPPIFHEKDLYVPDFEIWLRNKRIDRELIHDIISVSYKDSLKEFDSFEIAVNDWDATKRTFKYSNWSFGDTKNQQYMFDPGQTVELLMGYRGKTEQMRCMITGEITTLRPNFPSAGQPTLAISGFNVLHRLRKKPHTERYVNLTDSKIAAQIAARLKLEFTPDKAASREQPHKYLLQENTFDIVFLLERAHRIGYELTVEETQERGKVGKLVFRPSTATQKEAVALKYGMSLIAFQPNLTTAKQVGKVTVRGWDPVKKQVITGTAERGTLETKGVGKKGGQAKLEQSFLEREELVVDRPVESETEAKAYAKALLESNAKDMLKGSGSVVGLPELRAGSIVLLEGLGPRFSGRYFVTATTHTINDSGYLTQFECRREEREGA
jgi:uncharacterized protein